MLRTFLIFTSLSLILFPLTAQPQIQLDLYADGLYRPVDIAHAGDFRLFVAEQGGIIRIIDSANHINPTPFMDISDRVRNNESEQGLLGLVFHPEFEENGYFFVNYIIDNWSTRVSRFQLDSLNPNIADPLSEKILLTYSQPFINHNGGDMAFDEDGYLIISSGDGGSGGDPGDRAQDGQSLLGKILRIDVDNGNPYSIPVDNPFVDSANIRDEIWTLGWRNPWRFSFDRLTKDMWIADVGQDKFEEVSFEPASHTGGYNYGWRCYEGFQQFNTTKCDTSEQLIAPVFAYGHSDTTGRSITGGFVYRGTNFPDLYGHYIMGDYRSGYFWTIYQDTPGNFQVYSQGKLMGTNQCSSFGENLYGELFVAGVREGKIYQISTTTTSTDDLLESALKIYPNPWTDVLNIDFEVQNYQTYQLEIVDLQGRVLLKIPQLIKNSVQLNRGDIPAGLYLIRLSGEKNLVRKMIISD
ncbi:MAG: PQQ-dependent sugar dehydrogenase [Bacteroidia bacterium]